MPKRKEKKQTILLFDNDIELANNIKLYLEDTYTVRIIINSKELFAEINKNTYDFFIADFNSINIYFINIITKMRLNSSKMKIVLMCTFFDNEIYSERIILNKVDDYIFKPFNVNLLKNKIAKLHSIRKIATINY
jgi:DNA-binding response OmpR family regulator